MASAGGDPFLCKSLRDFAACRTQGLHRNGRSFLAPIGGAQQANTWIVRTEVEEFSQRRYLCVFEQLPKICGPLVVACIWKVMGMYAIKVRGNTSHRRKLGMVLPCGHEPLGQVTDI
jgi:hypothetical protein